MHRRIHDGIIVCAHAYMMAQCYDMYSSDHGIREVFLYQYM
jgi:hypothetical protein